MFKISQVRKEAQEAFTLLEILLVVAAIAILAGIVILALNPGKQLGDTRNSQRWSDVNTILNAVYQYALDNDGTLPTNIPQDTDCSGTATNEICRTDVSATCTGLVDISELTTNETYLVNIPTDPQGVTTNGAGYHIMKTGNNRITVCAPDAEQSETITVTR
jgi:prepilin-type N-terminal cleavage/methylation domain-containing protein